MGTSDSPGGGVGVTRVIVADNTAMGAQLLADALKRSHRFGTVLAASRASDVLTVVEEQAPDVALISAEFEDQPGRGFKLVQELRGARPGLKPVMLLDVPDRESVVQAFRVGGRGVFCRARSVKELLKCIACVQAGQIWANSEELGFVVGVLRDHEPLRLLSRTGVALLTPREIAVVRCVAEGLTNRQAAERLTLSEHTVKNYMFRIFDKLGVSTRVELILYAASQLQGNPGSQHGAFSQEGPAEAGLAWCRRAAEQGVGAAQFQLGQRYRDGSEVAVDRVAACMWFLVAERSDPELTEASRAALSRLAAHMTPDQVAEARRRASAWSRRHEGQVRFAPPRTDRSEKLGSLTAS